MTSTYSEKLRDPRWQKKRLGILTRDDWTCQRCGDKETTLVVHHRYYNQRRTDPWDYPDGALITWCENCHQEEHDAQASVERDLIWNLRFGGAFNDQLSFLGEVFPHIACPLSKEQWMVLEHHFMRLVWSLDDKDRYEALRAEWQALVKERGFHPDK
jgi:hypothetical protein